MKTVGAYEAKTHLPRLLREASAGESIMITNHGMPVAKLVPPGTEARRSLADLMSAARELRKRAKPLEGMTIKDLIAEGRRF